MAEDKPFDGELAMSHSIMALRHCGNANITVNMHPSTMEEWRAAMTEAITWHKHGQRFTHMPKVCISRKAVRPSSRDDGTVAFFVTEVHRNPADMMSGSLRAIHVYDPPRGW